MVRGFHGMLLLSVEYSGSLSDGKTNYERRIGATFDGPVFPFGAMVEYHFNYVKVLSRLHQFGKKVLPMHIPRLCVARGENLEGRQSWSQTLRTLIRWTHLKLNAKEVLTPMNGEKVVFPIEDGKVKLSGGDQVVRTSILIRDRPERGEE